MLIVLNNCPNKASISRSILAQPAMEAKMKAITSDFWVGCKPRKRTVEESFVLPMRPFTKRRGLDGRTVISWVRDGRTLGSVGVILNWGDVPRLSLMYHWHDKPVRMDVALTSMPTQFGGCRWWFRCPLMRDGAPCLRRAGKLYLPPNARYFGCRQCYDLTYRSSQEAHYFERMMEATPKLQARFARLLRRKGLRELIPAK